MKYLVLGLISLTLLGFVCAQTSQTTAAMNKTATTASNSTGNKNSTGTTSSNNQGPSATTTSQPGSQLGGLNGMCTTNTMGTKNGQSHIFTSVSLLFGSCALQALWQWVAS
ncbi:hypothetical protein Q8A73_000382 [Channa argus]|nr:hypothetical protein Q8A73_000382 [Channa argus]